MIEIVLKDGKKINVEQGASAFDATRIISEGLARNALACEINGKVCDLTTKLSDGDTLAVLTFDDEEGKRTFRHTAAHVLAQAVKRIYPTAKVAIGPAIDNGFYYDFDVEKPFSPEDLTKIEAEMKKIVKEKLVLSRFELPRAEALDLMRQADEPYKVELIENLPEDAVISFYKQGEFTDLCAGAHLFDTSKLKAIKLTSATGAYWRGDASRKMLQRIYGTCFLKNAELEAYLEAVEEAKKRDHNKIGRELEFFTTSDLIGQGLPIILPKGAKVIQILQRFVEDTEAKLGYQLTKTPLMAKSDLYKISGHWDHYRDGMFVMGDPNNEDEECFALRPMTCPFQYQAYLNRMRSYRDLPMRLGETATLFRNESSGEMHGLIRVRQFTISEGHLICTPEQLAEEFGNCVKLAKDMLTKLGLIDDISYCFSQWDPEDTEKYEGTPEQWENTQAMMGRILDDLNINYSIGIGDAAFYGPKLDIQIKNVHGKEDTIITIQVDELLAQKFGMEYIAKDGTKQNPCIIHRTSIGCYERTLALLIEKYAGALPLWMSPEQVRVIPVTDRTLDYADGILAKLKDAGIRCDIDDRSEKVGYKIREGQLEKVPYMIIVGDKDEEAGTISVRDRKTGESETMLIDELLSKLATEIAEYK